jgi:hypothetical protein
VAAPFQFRAQFQVIVDFAIEGDDGVAALREDGLIAGIQVDDLQPRSAQRDRIGFEDALLIRPAMNDGMNGAPDALGTRTEFELSKADDATQAINVA